MMNKEGFLNTKWDARDWTDVMKRKWQERMLELGFKWHCGGNEVRETNRDYFYTRNDNDLLFGDNYDYFSQHKNKEMKYFDAFSDSEPEKGQKHDIDKPRSQPRNKYDREILPSVYVDVYDVLRAFKTHSPALDHAAKKLLASGERGHKDRLTDLLECISSIQAEIDSMGEWS